MQELPKKSAAKGSKRAHSLNFMDHMHYRVQYERQIRAISQQGWEMLLFGFTVADRHENEFSETELNNLVKRVCKLPSGAF